MTLANAPADLGWDTGWDQAFEPFAAGGRRPARVVAVHKETAIVRGDPGGDRSATVTGRFRFDALATSDFPAVGDWVALEPTDVGAGTDDAAVIAAVLPRRTAFVRSAADASRRTAGNLADEQVIAANVDIAFLVAGLDGDFNLRRLERYLSIVKPAAIWPIIILTKRDLCDDVDARLDALRDRLPRDIAVHAVDARAENTAAELAPYLGAGQTIVVLGSSGAGKSTLTNTLLGAQVQSTGGVREDDSRGRHTTTSRSLHLLPMGGCIIDTPGLRGLRPDIDEEDLAATFEDIQALSEQCRFRDCRHRDEPGCAVRAGVHDDRLANYQKMLREIRRDTLTPLQRREQLSIWKIRHRVADERMKMKRGKSG